MSPFTKVVCQTGGLLAFSGLCYLGYKNYCQKDNSLDKNIKLLLKETPVNLLSLWQATFIYREMIQSAPKFVWTDTYSARFTHLNQHLNQMSDEKGKKAQGIFKKLINDLNRNCSFFNPQCHAVKQQIIDTLDHMDLKWSADALLVSDTSPTDPIPQYPKGEKGEFFKENIENAGTGGIFFNVVRNSPLRRVNITLTENERYLYIEFMKDTGFTEYVAALGFNLAKGVLGNKTFQTDNPIEMRQLFELITKRNYFKPEEVNRLNIQLDTTIRKPMLAHIPEYPADMEWFTREGSNFKAQEETAKLKSMNLTVSEEEKSLTIHYEKGAGFKEYLAAKGFNSNDDHFKTSNPAEIKKLIDLIIENNNFLRIDKQYLWDQTTI